MQSVQVLHFLFRQLSHKVNYNLIGIQILGSEAWNDTAEIVFTELCVSADVSRQETFTQRAEGNETDA